VIRKPHTAKQGQYLAFIYYYTKIHRCPPAEYAAVFPGVAAISASDGSDAGE
jgi:hypothetical protein